MSTPSEAPGALLCPCPIPPRAAVAAPAARGSRRHGAGGPDAGGRGRCPCGPAPAPPRPGPADSLVCPGQTGGRAGADAAGPERAARERAEGAAAPSVLVGAPRVPDSFSAGPWRAPGPASTRCSWSRPPW